MPLLHPRAQTLCIIRVYAYFVFFSYSLSLSVSLSLSLSRTRFSIYGLINVARARFSRGGYGVTNVKARNTTLPRKRRALVIIVIAGGIYSEPALLKRNHAWADILIKYKCIPL